MAPELVLELARQVGDRVRQYGDVGEGAAGFDELADLGGHESRFARAVSGHHDPDGLGLG